MDNQVAEFEVQEREWAVDRILSHKGSRSDAMFKVRWKAGDITWLPYEQVDHLGALREYFDVLGVDDVSALADGNGSEDKDSHVLLNVLGEDSHVFLGALGLGGWNGINQPSPSSSSSSLSTPPPRQHPSMSNTPLPTPLFCAQSNGMFVMTDRYRPGVTLAIALDQLRLYLQYDADLHSGAHPNTIIIPIGYDDFAVALNLNAGAGVHVAIVQEGNEGVRITGRPPALAELVGIEATRRAVPAPRDPREEAGGKWLDSRRSELMDHALWDNLERIKKQRTWREKSVAERQAKRRRREDDEAMRPFAPSTSLKAAVAGPISQTQAVPSPPPTLSVPAPEAPVPPPEDEEMRDVRDKGDAETTHAPSTGKELGRIPKKKI